MYVSDSQYTRRIFLSFVAIGHGMLIFMNSCQWSVILFHSWKPWHNSLYQLLGCLDAIAPITSLYNAWKNLNESYMDKIYIECISIMNTVLDISD